MLVRKKSANIHQTQNRKSENSKNGFLSVSMLSRVANDRTKGASNIKDDSNYESMHYHLLMNEPGATFDLHVASKKHEVFMRKLRISTLVVDRISKDRIRRWGLPQEAADLFEQHIRRLSAEIGQELDREASDNAT